MEDIYTIVDKAIDIAFEEQKFHLHYYDFMKSCKTCLLYTSDAADE